MSNIAIQKHSLELIKEYEYYKKLKKEFKDQNLKNNEVFIIF
jgi:hypothetical protein